MEPLVKLVSRYRRAKYLSQRIRLGEQLASAVGPHVLACLLRDLPVEKAERIYLRAVRWVIFRLGEFHGKTDRAFRGFCRRVVRQQFTQPQPGRHRTDEALPEQLWQIALRDDDEDLIVELVRQYQATSDLHLGLGDHQVRVLIEKPTAAHSTWIVDQFFTISIRPEGKSQIFRICDPSSSDNDYGYTGYLW